MAALLQSGFHRLRGGMGLLLAVGVAGLAGCTTTTTLRTTDKLSDHADKVFHYQVQSSTGHIVLRDGRRYEGSSLRIEGDSLYWETGEARLGAPLREVGEVSGTNHVNGLLEGFGIGLLGGAVVGAGIGAGSTQGGHPNLSGPFIMGVLGGALGSVVGLVVGAFQGHTYTYKFSNEPEPTED